MTPEAEAYLEKARTTLAEAEIMIGVHLYGPAGRAAYLTAFHTAQALISERLGKSVKTHKGVHSLFQQLTRDDSSLPAEFRRFVSATYEMKMVADYDVGPQTEISNVRAKEAVALAHRFLAFFAQVLGG